MANEPDLSRLILDAKGDRSYERMSTDCGGTPTSKRLQQMATGPLKAFPDGDTLEGIARGTGESLTTVVLAAARSLGLRVYASGDPDAFVIGDASSLWPDQIEATRVLIRSFQSSNRAVRREAWSRALRHMEETMATIDKENLASPDAEDFQRTRMFIRLQGNMENYAAADQRLRDGDLSAEEQAHVRRVWDRLNMMVNTYADERGTARSGSLDASDPRALIEMEERVGAFIASFGPASDVGRGIKRESPPEASVVDLFEEAAHTPQDPPGAGEHGEP